MSRKIVLLLIAVLCAWFTWTSFKDGVFGIPENDKFSFSMTVPSYNELKDRKQKLDASMLELETLNSSKIKSATDKVETELENYQAKKQAYDLLALSASEEEIAEANKIEKYLLDYLWIKVGNYAADNNVKFKMTDNVENANIDFDITGGYVSVINFIYDLENDVELGFDIEGIAIEGGTSSDVKAYFRVEDINVVTSPDEV